MTNLNQLKAGIKPNALGGLKKTTAPIGLKGLKANPLKPAVTNTEEPEVVEEVTTEEEVVETTQPETAEETVTEEVKTKSIPTPAKGKAAIIKSGNVPKLNINDIRSKVAAKPTSGKSTTTKSTGFSLDDKRQNETHFKHHLSRHLVADGVIEAEDLELAASIISSFSKAFNETIRKTDELALFGSKFNTNPVAERLYPKRPNSEVDSYISAHDRTNFSLTHDETYTRIRGVINEEDNVLYEVETEEVNNKFMLASDAEGNVAFTGRSVDVSHLIKK